MDDAVELLDSAYAAVENVSFATAAVLVAAADLAPAYQRAAQFVNGAMPFFGGEGEVPQLVDFPAMAEKELPGIGGKVSDVSLGIDRFGSELLLQGGFGFNSGLTRSILDSAERLVGARQDKAYMAGYIGAGLIGPGFGVRGLTKGTAKLLTLRFAKLELTAAESFAKVGKDFPKVDIWANPKVREDWLKNWLADPKNIKPENGMSAAAQYQRAVAGPNQVRLSASDGTQIWADGVRMDPDGVAALDAKFVTKPGGSMYEGNARPRCKRD